jgi:IS4 transposase
MNNVTDHFDRQIILSYKNKETKQITKTSVRFIGYRLFSYESNKYEDYYIITNILDKKKYTMDIIKKLYTRRWEIETCIKTLKTRFSMYDNTSKSENLVKQELYSTAILSLINRLLTVFTLNSVPNINIRKTDKVYTVNSAVSTNIIKQL